MYLGKAEFGQGSPMGDVALGPAIHRWLNLPLERKPRPNVERCYRELIARPAAQRALPLPVV